MIGVKVNGRFLDLKPATYAEIERTSPFFSINAVMEEYSTPLSFLYTENNCIALGFIYQFYTKRQKTKVIAELYDGSRFKCKCTLVIETGKLNLNRVEDAEMSGYVLLGVSDFFQQIKDKLLSDLQLDGVRTFNFTTFNAADGSNGFWQHIHETWTSNTIGYVFAPIRNESYNGDNGTVDWMNKLDSVTGGKIAEEYDSPLVPLLKIKYLLECIFKEHGFTIDFSGLNDNDWERLLLVDLANVMWTAKVIKPDFSIGDGPASIVHIDLKKHVPQEKKISDFIVQLFGRYAWAPVVDLTARKVRLVAGKELGKGTRKDWTKYAEPVLEDSFAEEKKIYSFTNEIDSNDSFPSAPDFTGLRYTLPAFTARYLPTPRGELEGRLTYCYLENKWYHVELDIQTNQWVWVIFADNIYNEERKDSTETIATTVSTLPVYFSQYREDSNGVKYFGFFPFMKQESDKPIGYRTLLYHGLTWETKDDGGQGVVKYPYASSIRTDPVGNNVLAWSNVYTHKNFSGTQFEVDYGIIAYWWKDFLNILKAGEEMVFKLWLPYHELINFAWDDVILILNIPFVVKQITEPLPYKGFVQATLKRLTPAEPEVIAVASNTPDGNVYAHLSVNNNGSTEDVIINLYADANATIPYTPAATLYVYVRVTMTYQNGTTYDLFNYYPVSTSQETILANAPHTFNGATFAYALENRASNGYIII
jgi:hypothetical protein